LRIFTHRVLESLAPVEDQLPEYLRQRLKMPDLWTALRQIHFPPPDSDLRLYNAFRSPAQFRLIFEEFFWLECGVALKRGKARTLPGIAFEIGPRVRERVKAMLPFKPTGAQKRVIQEIADDMKAPHPMNRLLQGDVGSGKTIVAAEAAVIAIENGYQVAVLAPTEILATQHAYYFKQILSKLGYVTVLLTGSSTSRERRSSRNCWPRAWRTWPSARTRCSKKTSSSTSWASRSSTSSTASASSSASACWKRASIPTCW